jgi:hypothetical protein
VSPAKNITADKDTKEKTEDNGSKVAGSSKSTTGDESKKPAPTGRRPLGTKEVIPFEWKLIGVSQDTALILFKAVDRADVEAQYERVKREGYYTDLRIVDINEKVKQPKPPKPVKGTARRRARKTAGAAKKPATRAAKRKRTAKATAGTARPSRKKTTKKATAKAPGKKKKASAESRKKKAGKKKKR